MRAVNFDGFALFTLFMLLLVAAAIFSADTGFAHAPIDWVQKIPYGDKWAHCILYGSLTFGLGRSFLAGFHRTGLAKAVLWVGLFTFAEELSQFWFPLRTVDAGDLAANIIGLGLAQLALRRRCKTPISEKTRV